jgi:predicted dehydrogenase
MFKIGILGSDNSHADRFSEILNLPSHPSYLPDSGAQVVAIWGQEAERTQQVAQNNNIATIVDNPTHMIGQVDAVICVTRHGGLHRELATPYLEAGIPTFVDKPLAVDPDDARAIVAAAQQYNVPFTSFSTVRFSADTRAYLAEVEKLGGVRTGVYTGPASRRNIYGGMIFYAIHSIELMLAVQGTGVQWVQAVEGPAVDARRLPQSDGNGNATVICAWADGGMATLHLTVDAHYGFRAMALGREGFHCAHLNISDCYHEGMKRILPTLRGEIPSDVPPEAMIEAIQIGAAIERSLDENRQVMLEE